MLLGLDTETALTTPENRTPPIACLQLADARNVSVLHHSEIDKWLDGIIRDPTITICGHHISYDLACIAARLPHLMPFIFWKYESDLIIDTEELCKLIDISNGKYRGFESGAKIEYNLGVCTKRFLGKRINKDNPWRLRFGELIGYPLWLWPKEAIDYARDDARAPYDLVTTLWQIFPPDTYRQSRAQWWLQLAANRGILLDPDRVDDFERNIRALVVEYGNILIEHGLAREVKRKGEKTISRIVKAAQERMRQHWHYDKPLPKTDGGAISLAADYLFETDDGPLNDYAKFSKAKKKLSTDVKILRNNGGRIHTHYDALKDTGRTGSASPPVQNWDRVSGIRECAIPSPGFVYACADYGKGELHTWAQICKWLLGYSTMGDALLTGLDPHLDLAAQFAGCTYAEAKERLAKGDPIIEGYRNVSKAFNFGCPGGAGIARLVHYAKTAFHVNITHQQAKDGRKMWRNKWREARPYHAWANTHFNGFDDPTLTTYVHPVSKRVRGGLNWKQLCNGPFQGLLADAFKHAGFAISKACYVDRRSALYGGHIVIPPHDEFITEVIADERAHFAAEEQARIMHEKAADYVPDYPPHAEPLLAACWSKKAKPIRVNGRLIPWDIS